MTSPHKNQACRIYLSPSIDKKMEKHIKDVFAVAGIHETPLFSHI